MLRTFWTGPAFGELALVHRALVPGGRLAVLYGPGPDAAGLPSVDASWC